jgi:hypothetical protein
MRGAVKSMALIGAHSSASTLAVSASSQAATSSSWDELRGAWAGDLVGDRRFVDEHLLVPRPQAVSQLSREELVPTAMSAPSSS